MIAVAVCVIDSLPNAYHSSSVHVASETYFRSITSSKSFFFASACAAAPAAYASP